MMISVGITSFNHEHCLERAVKSVLEQQCSFPFEIILSDDGSTDGTPALIQKLKEQYPQQVIVATESTNKGPAHSGRKIFELARGKYLCWLDADDLWIYPGKLEKQLSFLEENSDYTGCFHDAAIRSEGNLHQPGTEGDQRFHQHWKTYSQFNCYSADFHPWDALQRKIIPTASLLFRKVEMDDFFRKFSDFRLSISWAIHLWLLKNGKFRYFNEVWSEYHDHPEGFSKKYSLKDFKLNNIGILETYLGDSFYQHLKKDLYAALKNEYFHLLSIPGLEHEDRSAYKNYLKQYVSYSKLSLKYDRLYFKDRSRQNPKQSDLCAE